MDGATNINATFAKLAQFLHMSLSILNPGSNMHEEDFRCKMYGKMIVFITYNTLKNLHKPVNQNSQIKGVWAGE